MLGTEAFRGEEDTTLAFKDFRVWWGSEPLDLPPKYMTFILYYIYLLRAREMCALLSLLE